MLDDSTPPPFGEPDAKRDGDLRPAVFLIVAVFLAALILLSTLTEIDLHWSILRVPDLELIFYDTRAITWAWECTREGIDVMRVNPCNPNAIPWNYPSFLLNLSGVGLGEEASIPLALSFIAALLAATYAAVGRLDLPRAVYVGLVFVSPPVLLGVERANIDLLIFGLIVSAVLISATRDSPRRLLISSVIIVLATFAKIFPVGAAVHLLRSGRRRFVFALLGIGLVCLMYALVLLDELVFLREVVPRSDIMSVGSRVIFLTASYALDGTFLEPVFSPPADRFVFLFVIVFAIVLSFIIAMLLRIRGFGTKSGPREANLFLAGGGIYCLIFLMGNNYDYRLIFLILVLPELFAMSTRTNERKIGIGLLATFVFQLYTAPYSFAPIFVANEAAGWLMFIGCFALILCHLPAFGALLGRLRTVRSGETAPAARAR